MVTKIVTSFYSYCYDVWCFFFKLIRRNALQKQPPRGVLKKKCSENMLQIYKRTPMPKCDFNKVAADLVTFTEEILHGKLHFLCSVLNDLLTNYIYKVMPLTQLSHKKTLKKLLKFCQGLIVIFLKNW